MPIVTEWYDEAHTIIIRHYIGHWTLAEGEETSPKFQELAEMVSGRFDIIANYLEASYTLPVGALWGWQQAATRRDTLFPNWGLTVFTAQNSLLQAYFEEGLQSTESIRKHCRLAKTIEEAVKIIMSDRASD